MDIVTWCGVPRYLHNDLPLGNPLGPPEDRKSQRKSVERALEIATEMHEPGIEVSEIAWPGDSSWKSVYACVTDDNREALIKMGEENRRRRAEDKANGFMR